MFLAHHEQEFTMTYCLQKGENTSLAKIDDFVIVTEWKTIAIKLCRTQVYFKEFRHKICATKR